MLEFEIVPIPSDERPSNVKLSLVNYRVGSLIVSNVLPFADHDLSSMVDG